MCVPACLNMILGRRGFEQLPQAVIATELGLVVPPRLRDVFPTAGVSENKRDWGVHPQHEGTSLKSLFARHDLPLSELFYLPSHIPSSFGYADFLISNLEFGNDVIVGYDYATVFGVGGNVGHVNLICDVDSVQDFACLLDPEFVDQGPQWVKIKDLINGIRAQQDGFWVIGTPEAVRRCAELI
jgi:hypothetical protein